MNKKFLLTLATAIGITAAATTALAAPLPAGTKLTITKTTDAAFVGPVPGCTNGSCFGMTLFSSVYLWTPLGPGTDGGLIIGKGQLSGGQEVNGLSSNNGELTEMWVYGANNGTFFTAPSDAGNIFDDQSCAGSGCGSNTTPYVTALKVWNTAWGGQTIKLGSASFCDVVLGIPCPVDPFGGVFVKTWTIDPAGTVPRKYRLTYNQLANSNVFQSYQFELVLAGEVIPGNVVLEKITITPRTFTGPYGAPLSFTISVAGPSTCRVGTPPTNAIVTLNGCTSGTYTADIGFIGIDSFTIIANDGVSDYVSSPVNVAVIAPSPTPTPTPTCTYGPHPQPTIAPLYYSTTTGQPVAWDTPATNCGITPPANGTATLTDAATCQGTYTSNSGFVGRDTFGYSYEAYVYESGSHCGYATISGSVNIDVCAANDKKCPSYTPTPTATPPVLTECTDRYPLRQTTVTGKQGHLSITVTGNLVSVNPNGKEIKICPMTTASYETSSTTPGATVVCKVKSNTGRGQGQVKVNDHIKCTDKPVGNDKINVKIKSGVYQRVM